jgi:hypothetical protein
MLCPKCSQAISLGDNETRCPHCGSQIEQQTEGLRPPDINQGTSQVPLLTFDTNGPFFTRLFNTWKETMFYPGRFFSQTPKDAGLGNPLLYAIIIGSISIIIDVLWQILFIALKISFFGTMRGGEMPPQIQIGMMIGLAVFSPIIMTIVVFIWAGILHLSAMIVGGNKKGFEATFRSVTYATSPGLFSLIPLCGQFIGGIWQIVLTIIGLKNTHQVSTGRAVIAYLLPLILCAGCGITLILLTTITTMERLSR